MKKFFRHKAFLYVVLAVIALGVVFYVGRGKNWVGVAASIFIVSAIIAYLIAAYAWKK